MQTALLQKMPQLLPLLDSEFELFGELSRLCHAAVQNEQDLAERMQWIDQLYEYAGQEQQHIALKLAMLITDRVYDYEQKNITLPPIKAEEALAFLMEDRHIKQKDLAAIATQSTISAILNGKRAMTVEQIKGFAEFFNVPIETFITQ